MNITIEDIKKAAQKLAGHVVKTPFLYSQKLSEITECRLYIKYENMQNTNSFKDRGAFIKLSSLNEEEKKAGVIAMSAGNHAQAVAFHAKNLGIPATIVMPKTTPFTKIDRTKALGANVVLIGDTLSEAQEEVERLIKEQNLTLVHPYDDYQIITGQATIALEMLEEISDLDIVIVPIGGGGLISGTIIAATTIKPDIEIIGVETSLYPAMHNQLYGKMAKCGGQTIAEGIAVKNISETAIGLCKEYLSSLYLVGETAIEKAINLLLTEQKTCSEGAAAIGLAAILENCDRFKNKKVGLILTGGNIDPRIMSSILYRELERERRIVNLRLQIDDRPGVLARIATILGENGANILNVSHRRMFLDVPAKGATLEIMIETRDGTHAAEIIISMQKHGYMVCMLDAPGGKEAKKDNIKEEFDPVI